MGLFGTQHASKGTIEEVSAMVHRYLQERGMKPPLQELSAQEGCGWWLQQGSAKIYIFVQDSQSGGVIRITSPLVFVPEKNLEGFFRKILTLNADLSGCALALHDNIVLVKAQRHTAGLDQEELDELVWTVAYVADLLDNQLAAEFGAKIYSAASSQT